MVKEPSNKINNIKDFRLSVIEDLISMTGDIQKIKKCSPAQIKNKKPYVPQEKRLKNVGHIPVRSTRRRCAFCSTSKVEHRTLWMCESCEVPLCLQKTETSCFQKFHKN